MWYHGLMTNEELEAKSEDLRQKIKKFENSRTLIAAVFAIVVYYVYDGYRDGCGTGFYAAMGVILAGVVGVFIYASILVSKLKKETKEVDDSIEK